MLQISENVCYFKVVKLFGYFIIVYFVIFIFSLISQVCQNWNNYSVIRLFHLVCQFGEFAPVLIRVFAPSPKFQVNVDANFPLEIPKCLNGEQGSFSNIEKDAHNFYNKHWRGEISKKMYMQTFHWKVQNVLRQDG